MALTLLLGGAVAAAAAAAAGGGGRSPLLPEDDCNLKMRELCYRTTGAACLACATNRSQELRAEGCSVERIDGLCLQTRLVVTAAPFGSVPAETPLLSVRAGACPADGRGPRACGLRALDGGREGEDAPPSVCLESSAVRRDNYFVTATGMIVDNMTGAVFPATEMLQLRTLTNDVSLHTTIHLAHFANYNASGPGGNLSALSLDLNAPGRPISEGDTRRAGIWSVTHAGSCPIDVPDPTYTCDRESVQCREDPWPIPGGERNRSACQDGCVRVEPCSEGFVYENITDIWRNVNNLGDGPSDPDGRGCSRGHCYGMDQIDEGINGTCSKHAAGTGVGGGKWYRFVGKDNTGMATAPVGSDHCGTAWPGWLSGWGDINTLGMPPSGYNEPGRYPELGEGIVDGTACFTKSCGVSGDTRPLPVATVRCSNSQGSDYLLWKLQYTGCSSSYCTDRHSKRESPCESGEYTTLEDPWRSVEHKGRATLPDGSSKMMTDLDLGRRCPVHGTDPTGVGDGHWYRFVGSGGTALPLASPEHGHCGSSYGGWLSGWNASADSEATKPPASYAEPGRYPTAAEGVTEMTACFHGKGFSGDPQGPCFASKQIGVVQCPASGPLLWRLPYAPDIWGPSGDCTYGYCTDPKTASSYGGLGHVNSNKTGR